MVPWKIGIASIGPGYSRTVSLTLSIIINNQNNKIKLDTNNYFWQKQKDSLHSLQKHPTRDKAKYNLLTNIFHPLK